MSACGRCGGAGLLHPRLPGGRVAWGALVFCACTRRAGEVAHPPLRHPDLDDDLGVRRIADPGRAERARRESLALRAAYREAEESAPPMESVPPAPRELTSLRVEVSALRTRLNGHLDAALRPRRRKDRL